jgi:hypothetical protein
MRQLIIEPSCFERELNIRKMNFSFTKDEIVAVFLLKEMLRQLYFVNERLNKQKSENLFELYFSNRILTDAENEKIIEFESQYSEMSYLKGGVYGDALMRLYSRIEVCKLNGMIDFLNPFEYAMIVLERGSLIDRETYPKSFYVNLHRIPVDITRYNKNTPYLVCTEDSYLNAINNYYKRTGVDFYTTETPLPPWMKEDNQRGYISEEYKKWS